MTATPRWPTMSGNRRRGQWRTGGARVVLFEDNWPDFFPQRLCAAKNLV